MALDVFSSLSPAAASGSSAAGARAAGASQPALQAIEDFVGALRAAVSPATGTSATAPAAGQGATSAVTSPPGTVDTSRALARLEELMLQLSQALGGSAPAQAPAQGSGNATGSAFAGASPALGVGSAAASAAPPAPALATPAASQNNTEQWIVAGINRAIAQCKINGYDPEQSSAVNTLRGYFSGDAQARSQAIHSLDPNLLAQGGAYETFDFGVHAIAGTPPQGLDTTMPTFKTAFDKDWSRPSFYDMINSTKGWPGDGVNYADPANRDAELNRKLSDAEISSFQNATLTPDLQALVQHYRTGA